jgi:hypothetical protein
MSSNFRMLVRDHRHDPGLWVESCDARSELCILQDQEALEKYIACAKDEGWELVSHTVKHADGAKTLIPTIEMLLFSRRQSAALTA